ncbi:MAG TPA: hypothetical protein VG737_17035 [Cyclobacteriaceae bacterium]|nr:hypothetical protein [Cyclobacteriaceae bacterium]
MPSNFHGQSVRSSYENHIAPPMPSLALHSQEKPAFQSGGSSIVFASLSPREKGFFSGIEGSRLDRNSMQQFYDCLATRDGKKIFKWMIDHNLQVQSRSGKGKLEWLNELPTPVMGSCENYLKTGEYDYFTDLKRQYKHYRSAASQGLYSLASPGVGFANRETDPPMLLFAVNGIHALGVGNPEDEAACDSQYKIDVSLGKLKSRIQQLKGEEQLEDDKLIKWDHPPFLFRLAQNFANGFFGHAKSFPDDANFLFDQRRNLNKGVIKSAGYEIVRELLGIDENLQPTGSRRILIDMQHLSAASRNDLYEKIFRIYNKNIDPANPIPVVFIGAAYSGIDYLIEMIKNAHEGLEYDDFRVNGYYGAGINLSDEDVLAVFWSQGLISLTLETRKLGEEMGGLEKMFSPSARSKALRLLGRQLAGIISIPFAYHLSSPLRIWDSISIGPGIGFESSVLEHYRSGVHIEHLKEDVEEVLMKIKKVEPMWFGGYKPCTLAEKICSGNMMALAARNY